MRVPQAPPKLNELIAEAERDGRMAKLLSNVPEAQLKQRGYLHWDKLRRYPAPNGITHREWWLLLKLSRTDALRPVGLTDRSGRQFRFSLPDAVMEELHRIDLGAGSSGDVPEPVRNSQTRDRFLISSLMEEAITSSQLEGAATTRDVAREMIRTGRRPRDTGEAMILNNYRTMQYICEAKDSRLTPEMVLHIHTLVTENTLDDEAAAGRLRTSEEQRVVGDDFGQVFHEPPPACELPARMAAMCDFANGETPGYFVHPAVRAMILHFWLAYDHPFVDGNGRTARALFYWEMLRNGYWLFEFLSISSILRKAPSEYGRSFLLTESDDNDLTYFLLAQTAVIRRAVNELNAYVERKTAETHELEERMSALDVLNHRQAALVLHALRHPGHRYTIASHEQSHGVVYQTARTDLLNLAERGLLSRSMRGKQMVFVSPKDLPARLARLKR